MPSFFQAGNLLVCAVFPFMPHHAAAIAFVRTEIGSVMTFPIPNLVIVHLTALFCIGLMREVDDFIA